MFHEEPTALARFFTSLPLLLLITAMTMKASGVPVSALWCCVFIISQHH